MHPRRVFRQCVFACLVLMRAVVWADGDPAKETPSSARMIPVKLGQVDAVTGDLVLRFPLGARLPGRIPLGFTFAFDSQDSVMSQIGASLKPVIWPGGSGSPQVTTVVVDGVPWVFQKKAAPAAGSMPTSGQIHQWMLQRGVDDGQAEAAAVNDPTAGITPAFQVNEILPTADGTRFFARTSWTVGCWKWDPQTKDTVPGVRTAAGRSVILSGADAIWTGTYLGNGSASTSVTHFTNKWGDHVTATEAGGKLGSPTSIVIANVNSPSEWVRWDRNDTAQTLTITSSPTIPLPSVTITGTFKDLERMQNYWSTYPTAYDPNATYNNTGIFDGGVIPSKIVVTAGNESRTTLFAWNLKPSYVVTNPWASGIQVTVPAAYTVSSITQPSGLQESFGYATVARLSTDSFNPPVGGLPVQGTVWTGYSAWSDFELPYDNPNEVYDPVNPAGAGQGVSIITTSIPASSSVGAPLLPMRPSGGGDGGGGGTSTSVSDGQTIIIARKQPSAHTTTSWNVDLYGFMVAFAWDQREHTTTILRYSTASMPQVTDAYRGVRLTHPSATGGCYHWGGSSGDTLSTQQAAYLFATSAVMKEEVIHGSQVTFSQTHPDDWEPVSPVVDNTVAYDQWDLSCWANPGPLTSLANGLPVTPHALKTFVFSPTLPGGTTNLSVADAYGPTQQDHYHNAFSGPAPTITGTSPATWTGSGGVLAQIYGTQTTVTPLHHTDVVTRHWDADLMQLMTDSNQKSLSGDALTTLRPGSGSSIDFGTTRYTYDSQGRMASVTGTRGTSTATEVRTYVDGQPLLSDSTKTLTLGGAVVPFSGQTGTSYTYDSTPYRWLKTETDKLDGRPTTIVLRDSMGRIQKVQSPEGIITDYTYDGWGRVHTKTREAKGAVGSVTTTYSFEPNGAWSEETTSYADADGQAISLTVHTDYDAAGRPVKVTNPDGSYQITQYDGWGEKALQSPVLKPGQTNYGNYQWTYDAKGRLVASYDPKGRRLSYQPNDPTWTGTDPGLGRVISTVYGPGPNSSKPGDPELPRTVQTDLLGQQREVIDQKGQTSSYTYNQDGKLASTNQNGQIRTYTYNDMGWLTSRNEPEEGLTTFSSFTIGGLPLLTTQKGLSQTSNLRTQVALNAWGLPSEIQVSNGTALSTDRVLTYDPATHRLMNIVESQPNGTLMESYGYDDIGRLNAKTIADEGGQTFAISRALDAAGQVASLTYPAGGGRLAQVATYHYDTIARPHSTVLDGAYRAQSNPDYQVSGTSVSGLVTFGNGASTLTRVDSGELAEVKHAFVGDVQDNFMKWSTGGLLLGRGPDATFAYPGKSDYFHYDNLQRLDTSTIQSWDDPDSTKWDTLTQTYGYDRFGNRSSEGFTWTSPTGRTKPDEVLAWSAVYDATNQIPVTITTTGSLSTGKNYDDLGRLTSVYAIPGRTDKQVSWTYDASGRVVMENGATFLLDGQGLRFRRNQIDGSIQYTVYGFNHEPLSVFLKPASGSSSSSGGATAMLLPIDGGGGGGGGGTLPPAGAFITQPSGPITVSIGKSVPFTGSSTYGTTLSWSFGDGGTASGYSTSHVFNAAGTFTVSLTATATGYASSSAYVTLTVIPAVKVMAFTVAPATITLGGGATLSWTTANATSLALDNGLGSVTGLTSKTVRPGQWGNLTYKLTATNAAGSTTATVPLYVSSSPAPVINSFTANPTAVPAGQPVTLKWNVTQAQTLSISGLTVTGKSCTVHPTVTTTYTLSATNGAGTVTSAVTVPVIGVPAINRFSAGPSGITTGQSTLLSWDVTGAATLTLSGGGYSWTVTGDTYRIVQPSATTLYTLTASNSAGGVTRQATVTVSAPGALSWVRSMVYGMGQLVSEERADVGTVYLQSDQVGSPSLMTDTSGHLVGRTKGLPFGERAWAFGTQSARRFTNHEDQPGSAVYMQARMYLPAYGKFAQPDPAYDQTKLDPESWNLYGYVTNNPVTHTDPDGRMAYQGYTPPFLFGNWGDIGFSGVSYSSQIMLGTTPNTINWEQMPAVAILDQNGFFLAYSPSYVQASFGSAQTTIDPQNPGSPQGSSDPLYDKTKVSPDQPNGLASSGSNLDQLAIKLATWEIDHNPADGLIKNERGGYIVDSPGDIAIPGKVMEGDQDGIAIRKSAILGLLPKGSTLLADWHHHWDGKPGAALGNQDADLMGTAWMRGYGLGGSHFHGYAVSPDYLSYVLTNAPSGYELYRTQAIPSGRTWTYRVDLIWGR